MADQYSMFLDKNRTELDNTYAKKMDEYFVTSLGSGMDKLRNFPKFVPRQTLSNFIAKNNIFEQIIDVHGYIIECGVHLGGGLMTWANLSAIYEPTNHIRRIVGFDTFEGFTNINDNDRSSSNDRLKKGGLAVDSYADVLECVKLYDSNRTIGHIPRVEVVKGDALTTIPEYVNKNKHLVVAMLYLDFDLYEPTKIALECFLPYMPKGSIIVFDELNQADWPGETVAVNEVLGIKNIRLKRFPFAPALSYAVIE